MMAGDHGPGPKGTIVLFLITTVIVLSLIGACSRTLTAPRNYIYYGEPRD